MDAVNGIADEGMSVLEEWMYATWSFNDLARKAVKEKLTAEQLFDWCISELERDAPDVNFKTIDGRAEMIETISERIDEMRSIFFELAAKAGYYRIDMQRLLDTLHRYPGCTNVKMRSLYNYMNGKTKPRGWVMLGLTSILGAEPATFA